LAYLEDGNILERAYRACVLSKIKSEIHE